MKKEHPLYLAVKHYILDGISDGLWTAGERVPSENELVDLCRVSRMTARRALQELYHSGTLIRIRGRGSFVAEEKQQSSLLQIRSIAADVSQKGLRHDSLLLDLKSQLAIPEVAHAVGLCEDDPVFHSRLLHLQNGRPIQLEDRWVNQIAAPAYLQQDFNATTPSDYLTHVAPVTHAEHIIEAIMGSASKRELLKVAPDEAILLLKRRTWCGDNLVSYAKLYHPGNHFSLQSELNPSQGKR